MHPAYCGTVSLCDNENNTKIKTIFQNSSP
jgi:hypothetical protein